MSDKPTILLLQPKNVPSAPEALVFLQGLSRVVTLSQNVEQNREHLKHEVREAEFNDDPNPIVVIQLNFPSRTTRLELAPGLNELVRHAHDCGLVCFILNRTVDRITWAFRQIRKLTSSIDTLLDSKFGTYELGPPMRPSELFDSQSYTGNHINWEDQGVKQLHRMLGIEPPWPIAPPKKASLSTYKTLSPGVAYHYLFG